MIQVLQLQGTPSTLIRLITITLEDSKAKQLYTAKHEKKF